MNRARFELTLKATFRVWKQYFNGFGEVYKKSLDAEMEDTKVRKDSLKKEFNHNESRLRIIKAEMDEIAKERTDLQPELQEARAILNRIEEQDKEISRRFDQKGKEFQKHQSLQKRIQSEYNKLAEALEALEAKSLSSSSLCEPSRLAMNLRTYIRDLSEYKEEAIKEMFRMSENTLQFRFIYESNGFESEYLFILNKTEKIAPVNVFKNSQLLASGTRSFMAEDPEDETLVNRVAEAALRKLIAIKNTHSEN